MQPKSFFFARQKILECENVQILWDSTLPYKILCMGLYRDEMFKI